jgi:hypothetical protein
MIGSAVFQVVSYIPLSVLEMITSKLGFSNLCDMQSNKFAQFNSLVHPLKCRFMLIFCCIFFFSLCQELLYSFYYSSKLSIIDRQCSLFY